MFELYEGLPRQGPGSDEATLAALSMVPGLPAKPDILDIGCGTGKQTLVLARVSGGLITAVDSHRPFLNELGRRAAEEGLSGRVRTLCSDMRSLPFAPNSFDLIWSEGAIYVMGFKEGLSAWKRLLRPGGSIALTELAWLVDEPPEEARAFWAECYPAMKTVDGNVCLIREAGYEPVGELTLPESAWWEDYYLMMEKRISVLRKTYTNDRAVQDGLDLVEKEMGVYRRCSHSYGYVFFIMRLPEG